MPGDGRFFSGVPHPHLLGDRAGLSVHRVREALTTLLSNRQRLELTPENQLLRAVQQYVREKQKKDYFWSQDFCAWANAQEERLWSGRPLTQAKLADMLRTYDIFPGQINRTVNGKQKNGRGYFVAQFDDAFCRYTDRTLSE